MSADNSDAKAESGVSPLGTPGCNSNDDDNYRISVSFEEDPASLVEMRVMNPSPEAKQMVLITVEDNGIGIAVEARLNLFQPFKQAQRMAGGTGLGLYSLAKRIDALRGSNGVTGRLDGKQGSMFWFTFPYRPDEAAHIDAQPDGATGLEQHCPGPGSGDLVVPKRILIVDDSLSILKVTSRLLTMKGHTVETAPNGSVGLKMLKEASVAQEFDMVLTDLQMPVMDGIEATRRFRAFEAEEMKVGKVHCGGTSNLKRMLIVGMSANSDNQSRQEALESGMDYFVTKPFSYMDLRNILLSGKGHH
jgi:CheY-like chemotaxis protein